MRAGSVIIMSVSALQFSRKSCRNLQVGCEDADIMVTEISMRLNEWKTEPWMMLRGNGDRKEGRKQVHVVQYPADR